MKKKGDGSERERKSVSCETTFRSTSDREELCETIRQLSSDLSKDLERHGLVGRSVTLKYKTDKFDVKTRVTQLMDYTLDGAAIAKAAIRLLLSEPFGLTLRLLGVRMSQLMSSTKARGSNSIGRKQRTLNELLTVECPATKKRKLDDATAEADKTLLFTCPVCHSWQTPDDEVALNRHIDECLNQQVLHSCSSSGSHPQSNKTTKTKTIVAQTKLDRFIIRSNNK